MLDLVVVVTGDEDPYPVFIIVSRSINNVTT
jgi:hypothetical protein